jgi:uncharacterized protein YukE
VSAPLQVDVDALEAAAREMSTLSNDLDHLIIHEWQPPVDQPSARAAVATTAATNHVIGECAGNLLALATNLGQAARTYRQTDSDAAGQVGSALPPQK